MTSDWSRNSIWFRRYRPVPDPRLRLVCFPHAGGTAGMFRTWHRWLPQDVELLAVQYPGRQDRLNEPCVENMDDLAEAIAGALRSFLDRPLGMFGHSMGASVAYEVTCRTTTRHDGADLRWLFVSGRKPPHRQEASDLHTQGDDAILDDIRRLNEADSAVFEDGDIRELVLPMFRADYRLIETYRQPSVRRIDTPIFAYVGSHDPDISEVDMRGWADMTTCAFESTAIPGDHFYLLAQERALLEDMARRLTPAPVSGRPARRDGRSLG